MEGGNIRKTHDKLRSGEGGEEGVAVCLQHGVDLEYVCVGCDHQLLCSYCLAANLHPQHEVRHLDRSRPLLYSHYQSCAIQLQSKNDMLGVILDELTAVQASTHTMVEQLQRQIIYELTQIQQLAKRKLEEVLSFLQRSYNQYTREIELHKEDIRLRYTQITQAADVLQDYIARRSPLALAQYFAHEQVSLRQLLQADEVQFYKNKISEPVWSIDPVFISEIQRKISSIDVVFTEGGAREWVSGEKERERDRPRKKKSRKALKLSELDRTQKVETKPRSSNSQSPNLMLSSFTPKNTSKQTRIQGKKSPAGSLLKKRRKSRAKMISMPASPAKDVQSTYLGTPQLSRKRLFKKRDK